MGTTSSNNHYKFTGKERDSESQLDYFGARYYANITGRFMSPDWAGKPTSVPYAEFGDPQSLNLYSYVRNSPVVRVDADGHNYAGMNGLNRDTSDGLPMADADQMDADIATNNEMQGPDPFPISVSGDVAVVNPNVETAKPSAATSSAVSSTPQQMTKVTVNVVQYELAFGGLNILLEATVTGSQYEQFNWIQTVTTDAPMNGQAANKPHLDIEPGQKTPFYWTPSEQRQYAMKARAHGASTIFYDDPRRDFSGKAIHWHANLSLVGIYKDGHFDRLKSYSYGFTFDATAGGLPGGNFQGIHLEPLRETR